MYYKHLSWSKHFIHGIPGFTSHLNFHNPPSHHLLFHFLCLVLPSLLQSFLSPPLPPMVAFLLFVALFSHRVLTHPLHHYLSSVSFTSLFFLFLSLLVVLVAAPSAHRVCLLVMHLGVTGFAYSLCTLALPIIVWFHTMEASAYCSCTSSSQVFSSALVHFLF